MKLPFRHEPAPQEIGKANFDSCSVRDVVPDLTYNPYQSALVEVNITTSCPKLEDLGRTALTITRSDDEGRAAKITAKAMEQTATVFSETICNGCDYADMTGPRQVASYRRELAEDRLATVQANLEIQQLSAQLRELNP